MKKPKLKKYPTGGSKGFIPDKLVHYVGQGETPYTREQLGSMGYNYETTTGGFDEYSMGDNRRFYKTVLPNTPEWSNPENPYLISNTKQAITKTVPKPKYPSYGSPEYIKTHPEYTPPSNRIVTFSKGGTKLPKYFPGGEHESTSMIEDYRAEDGSNFWDGANGQESYYKSQEPIASAADQQQINNTQINNNQLSSGQYAAIGSASATGSANIYNAYNSPRTSEWQKNQQAGKAIEKTETQVAGAINPIVGMIHGTVSGIMDKSTAEATKTDSQGNLVNRKQAKNQAIGRAFADPMAMIPTMISTGFNRDRYANQIEADAKARIAEEQAPMLAAAEAKRNMYYTYAQGGTKGDPTIEKNKKFLEDYYKETFNNSVYRTLPEDVKTMDILTKTIGDYMYKLPGTDEQKYSGKTYDSFLNGIQDIRKKYPARPGYSNGGIHSGMPNAELENKEMYNIPGGPISEVNGPSHKQGGVPVSIPNGTEMLPDNSDSLKINTKIVKMFPNLFSKKDIGKTFSDTSRNLKTTKEDKIMKDDKASNMSKSTASLNIEVKKAIYQQKMKALEEFKKSKLQDYAKKLGVTLPQAQEGTEDSMQYSKGGEKGEPYDTLQVLRLTAALSSPLDGSFKKAHDELKAYENKKYLEKNFPGKNAAYQPDKMKNGGTKLPKFDGGMRYIDPENLRLAQQAQSGFPTMEEVEDPSFNNALYNKYQTPFIRPSEAERLKNERSNSKQQYVPNPNDPYEQAMAAGKEFEQPAKQVNPKTGNYDWVEPTANTLMQNAGNIAYLAGEGKKYDKQDFYKYNPELYNPADALRQADIEARVNRGKLKDASGGNAGALMSNLTQSQAINTLLKSKIRTDAANQNAGTLNDAQIRNIQGKYNVDDINARNKGQALTNYYNAIRGIGQNTSGAYRDWKRGEVDQQTLDIISKNYPDYVYDKRRKGWYHKSTDKKLE